MKSKYENEVIIQHVEENPQNKRKGFAEAAKHLNLLTKSNFFTEEKISSRYYSKIRKSEEIHISVVTKNARTLNNYKNIARKSNRNKNSYLVINSLLRDLTKSEKIKLIKELIKSI